MRHTGCSRRLRSRSSATWRAGRFTAASADVVVCDGFTGNIVLKTSEGLVETVEALLGEELQGTFSSQVGLSAVEARVPAVPAPSGLLGVRRRARCLASAGLVVVGHGRSSAQRGAKRRGDGVSVCRERLHVAGRAGIGDAALKR